MAFLQIFEDFYHIPFQSTFLQAKQACFFQSLLACLAFQILYHFCVPLIKKTSARRKVNSVQLFDVAICRYNWSQSRVGTSQASEQAARKARSKRKKIETEAGGGEGSLHCPYRLPFWKKMAFGAMKKQSSEQLTDNWVKQHNLFFLLSNYPTLKRHQWNIGSFRIL